MHHAFETTPHQIDLASSLQFLLLLGSKVFLGDPNFAKHIILDVLFPLSFDDAWLDMFDVLEPLEVTDSDSTCIQEDVRQNTNVFLHEHLLSLLGSRSIGSFSNDATLEPVCILRVDSLFHGSRTENVAWLVDSGLVLVPLLDSWIVMDALVRLLELEVLETLRVDTSGVIDRPIVFSHSH